MLCTVKKWDKQNGWYLQPLNSFGEEEPAVREARRVLRGVPSYRSRGLVGRLSPFQCLVLDKFEGVLAGDLLDLRRYPDVTDARVLLQLATCQVVVFEGNDLDRGAFDL